MAYPDAPLLATVTELASRQHGIVDSGELARAGVARSTQQRWLEDRRLVRLHRGVFSVIPPVMLTQEGRWLAAVRACGPRAFLSHAPAGQLGGIVPRRERWARHVSIAGRSHRRVSGVVVHRPLSLPPGDTTVRHRIPTTTATRTVWDLAATLSPLQARRAYERADRDGLLDRIRLEGLLAASPSRTGAAVIRALLASRPLPLAETRSGLEELLLRICRDHGLALPAVNVPVGDYEVDFLWAEARFIVEADGGDHLTPSQRDRDNERDVLLARAGYLVRRYSSIALADERAVAAEVLGILAERLGRFDAHPAG